MLGLSQYKFLLVLPRMNDSDTIVLNKYGVHMNVSAFSLASGWKEDLSVTGKCVCAIDA